MKEMTLVLHNIRSAHNVGAMLRTADGAGVKKVYLCGYTPVPTDRFGRKRKDIAKVALGAEESIAWEYVADARVLLTQLKENDVQVMAVEQSGRSVPYTEFAVKKPIALVLGPEVEGIEEEVLGLCDTIIEIPMYGKKESLNVSVAAGVVLYELVRHYRT